MKSKCSICGKRKAQRRCSSKEDQAICGLCCAEKRDESCGECSHRMVAQQRHEERCRPGRQSDGHFIAELNPELELEVNDVLSLAEGGQMDQARSTLERLSFEHPLNHTVCFAMGALCAMDGKHQETIRWCDKAIAIYPYFMEAHYNKAVAYQKQLDVSNAVRAFRKVVEFGDGGDLIVKQAKAFLDGMTKTIRKSHGIDLDCFLEGQDEFDRAFVLMEEKDWLSALVGFRASAAKNDLNASTHGNIGLCLAKLGRKAEALAELDRAVAIDPGYSLAEFNRVTVERMEEGRPLEVAGYQQIEFNKERLLHEKNGDKSWLKRFFSKKKTTL